MAISETFVDIRAELDGLRADLNKANAMMSSQLGQGVKFGKMTAIFSGITAGLTGVMAGIKLLKGVANTIAIPFKVAFKFIKGAAKVAIGAIKKAFGGLISIAKSVGRAIQAAFSAGREFISGAIDVAKDFSEQMSSVGALTGTIGTEGFDVLREKALALGSATEFSATQAAAAMANFSRAGQDVDQILNSIGPTLDFATSNFLDLDTASAIANKTLSVMGLTAGDLNRVTDAMTLGANKTNQSIHDLGAAIANVGVAATATGLDFETTVGSIMSFAQAGFQGSDAGTALKNIMLQMPSESATKFFKDMEVSIADADGNFRNFADIIDDTRDAVGRLSQKEASEKINKAFGKIAGPAMQALMKQGGDAIRDYTEQVRKSAGFAAEQAEVQRGSFANSFKIVASAADDLRIRLVDVLEPLIRGSNERAVEALNFLSNFVRTKGPEIRDTLVGAFNVAKDSILDALTLTVGYVANTTGQISGKWESLKTTFMSVAASVSGAAMSFFGQDLVNANTGPIERIVLAMKVAFANILASFKQTVISIEDIILRVTAAGSLFADLLPGSPGAKARQLIISRRQTLGQRAIDADKQRDATIAAAVAAANQAGGQTGQDQTISARERGSQILQGLLDGMNSLKDEMTNTGAGVAPAAQKTAEEIKKEMKKAVGEVAKPSTGAANAAAQTPSSAVAGTISTVFGEMKTGTDQQVVLLKDILATNKLIASNTRSGGMSGFTSVGG